MFKLQKALYELKQAPRAWYEQLSKFFIEKVFCKSKVDTTLFIKEKGKEILLVQVYVDDILNLCQELMQGEFEMLIMGELTYFLGLQIK